MSLDRLVYMANQIGKFFTSQGQEQAATGTADHIRKFWDPRMRAEILAHFNAGGAGMDPVVRLAIEHLAHERPTHEHPTETDVKN